MADRSSPPQPNESESELTTKHGPLYLGILNIVFIVGLCLFVQFFFVNLTEISETLTILYLFKVIIAITFLMPYLAPLGRVGCILSILGLIPTIPIFFIGSFIRPSPLVDSIFLIGLMGWMNFFNHRIINGKPITIQEFSWEEAELNLYRYDPQNIQYEKLIIGLAFIYLISSFLIYLLGRILRWVPFLNGFILVISSLFALNMFWYASKYSRKVSLIAILMGNSVLVMTIVLDLSMYGGFEIIIGIALTNIGLILLGTPTAALDKEDPLRRWLIFNWMGWSIYFTIGLIYAVYIYDAGVFIEFVTGFAEVSLIVGGAYKDTLFWEGK